MEVRHSRRKWVLVDLRNECNEIRLYTASVEVCDVTDGPVLHQPAHLMPTGWYRPRTRDILGWAA